MTEDVLRHELAMTRAELAHLRGWKQGAEEGIEHLRKEVEYWKTMALRATADEMRVKELEAALRRIENYSKQDVCAPICAEVARSALNGNKDGA